MRSDGRTPYMQAMCSNIAAGGVNMMQQSQYNGSVPVSSQNGHGLMSQNGGLIPPALLQENRLPRFYLDALAHCGANGPSQYPNTALVYNLMITSHLPRPVLGNIWSLVNRTLPGQLTRQEFFSCLALIALAQNGQSLPALSTVSCLPVPQLQLTNLGMSGHTQCRMKQSEYMVVQPSVVPHIRPAAPIVQPNYAHRTSVIQKSGSQWQSRGVTRMTTPFVPANLLLGDVTSAANGTKVNHKPSGFSDQSASKASTHPNSHIELLNFSEITLSQSQSNDALSGMPAKSSTEAMSNSVLSESVAACSVPSAPKSRDDSRSLFSDDLFDLRHTLKQPGNIIAPQVDISSNNTSAQFDGFSSSKPGCSQLHEVEKRSQSGVETIKSSFKSLEASPTTDIYAAVKDFEGLKGSGSLTDEKRDVWTRCVAEVCSILKTADELFSKYSQDVVKEVSQSEKGSNYLKALEAAHAVVKRLRSNHQDALESVSMKLEEIDKIWKELINSVIVPEVPIEDNIMNGIIPKKCGICVSNIDESHLLEFAGKFYHRQCANLWTNRVDSLLPKLC
ncbi:hypothetical protein AB6A40_008336 [Gnathostoma spinigerum]|uniref:EH domain-containing protein n=1 Tax=Gnathostoma spinigerum TaxID=75299 RepID=A0ABD6ER56_9BILA